MHSAYNPNLYQNVKYHGMCLYFERISTSQETEPLSFLLCSFISLCLPRSVVKTPFFLQIQLHVLGFLLHQKTRHNGQVQGILHGHTFVPFPGTALLLHGAISVPEGQRE